MQSNGLSELQNQLFAQPPEMNSSIRVSTFNARSVSIQKTTTGEWEGIFMDVWEKLAKDLQFSFNITQSASWDGMLESLQNESSDVAVYPLNRISINAKNRYRMTAPIVNLGSMKWFWTFTNKINNQKIMKSFF